MSESGNSSIAAKSLAMEMSRLFHDVPESVKNELVASAQQKALARNATLFEYGDQGESMFVVLSGRIEISILSKAGRRIVLNLIPEGRCFGEISMVDRQKRTASAIALEPSVVMAVTRSHFLKAALACPKLAINLAEILCERLRWVSASVEEYALFAIDLRLARRLLSMHANFGDLDGNIATTQNELADYIGATRESTNKILVQWKNAGLVGLRRGSVQILKTAALEHIAKGGEDG